MRKVFPVVAVVLAVACARVDETEYCVKTRFGNVVAEGLEPGLTNVAAPGVDLTCFSLTDQNFPERAGKEEDQTIVMKVQTGGGEQPLTIEVNTSFVYAFDPQTVYNVFLQKRSEEAAEVEIFNAVQEGVRSAFSSWTVSELFGEHRPSLSDSVLVHVQRKVGDRAMIRKAFVGAIKLPQAIEEARSLAAQQAQVLDKARSQYIIDSVQARGRVMQAEADSRAKELMARSYAENPKLLDLEIAREWSSGFAQVCKGTQTCIVGGNALDLMPLKRN